jgi:hypothetical protein
MRAAIFRGPKDVTVGERPDPSIHEPTDALVRVVLACVCGSDLWYYRFAAAPLWGPTPRDAGDPFENGNGRIRDGGAPETTTDPPAGSPNVAGSGRHRSRAAAVRCRTSACIAPSPSTRPPCARTRLSTRSITDRYERLRDDRYGKGSDHDHSSSQTSNRQETIRSWDEGTHQHQRRERAKRHRVAGRYLPRTGPPSRRVGLRRHVQPARAGSP